MNSAMDAGNSPNQPVQWPGDFRPSDDYIAPDLKVVEPFGVRFKRFFDRAVAGSKSAIDDYLYGLQHVPTCRIGTIALIAIILGIALRVHLQNRPATLQVVCSHQFHAAELIVWADDQKVIDEVVTGAAIFDSHHWRPYWQREAVAYTAPPFTLTHQPHTIRVRVASTEDPYDRMQLTTVDLPSASDNTLQVACGKGRLVLSVFGQDK